MRERMRALTFEVICPGRLRRHRARPDRATPAGAPLADLDAGAAADAAGAAPRPRAAGAPGACSSGGYGGRRPDLRGDRRAGEARRPRGPDRRPLAPAPGPRRGRRGDERPRAPRRADDDAAGGPRDDRDRPRLRLRPPAAQPRSPGPPPRRARRRRRRLPERGRHRDPAAAAGDRRRRAHPDHAPQDRRMGPPGRDPRLPGGVGGAAARGHLPAGREFRPERFLDEGARPTPGSRSAAGSAVASAPPSRRRRWPR